MNNQKVWFVTGASKGMGLETVNAVLKNGDKVAATSRNLKELIDQIVNQNEKIIEPGCYYYAGYFCTGTNDKGQTEH